MRASDIMTTDVLCINAKESVFDAAELLLGAGVSAAPVVNDQGTVVGIISVGTPRRTIGALLSRSRSET